MTEGARTLAIGTAGAAGGSSGIGAGVGGVANGNGFAARFVVAPESSNNPS